MTITLKGRTFTVQVLDKADMDRPVYELTGPRGARYVTFRNEPNPDRMFLVAFRPGSFTPDPLGPLWLTDKDGDLRVV